MKSTTTTEHAPLHNEASKIEVIYNKLKHRLTILKDGKPAGGFAGPVAHRMAEKIIINNAKVEVKDGHIQVGV